MSARLVPSLAVTAALHLVGWGALLALVVPSGATLDGMSAAPLASLGIGVTAYLLGIRHAFDPDHIAAIDGSTRRLVGAGRSPRGVGLWFSLGHSTVVAALCLAIAAAGPLIAPLVTDDSSPVHQWAGAIGPLVSSTFLIVVALANIASIRQGASAPRGPVGWLLGRFDRVLDRPSRMYLIGVLFGLGFDTATEIGLLALAASAAVTAAPWWVVLVLPVLFAAGMTGFDSAQGELAYRAYRWGSGSPLGVSYRTITAVMSIGIALVVAAAQLATLLGSAGSSMPFANVIDIGWLGLAFTVAIGAAWAAAAIRSSTKTALSRT
ncbi:MAG TPA: HoxN/HupN/NixA family nickel/cobalt transporter [Candidatus Lumbricidophila sp.]|nr:HoxN/HupN/NixA family nickel/cobalt transporter [Candidatus Lumbricidophila sp.]